MSIPLEEALASWRQWQPELTSPPIVLGSIASGLTNRSWIIDTTAGRAVLRLNSPLSHVWNINREREFRIHTAAVAAGLAPAILYCDPGKRFLVTDFYEGEVLDLESIRQRQLESDVIDLVASIQNLDLGLPKFNYFRHLLHYKTHLETLGARIPDAVQRAWQESQHKLAAFSEADWKPVTVHHDLLSGNIILGEQGFKVIDWEYGAGGYGDLDLIGLNSAPRACNEEIVILQNLMNLFWELLYDRFILTAQPPQRREE